MNDEKVNNNYDSSSIQVLEGLEAVRKRPGMYIGTTDVKGLHHLVWEIVDNAIDEALAGYCHNVEIVINKDNSITVKDDGRGIPVDIHPKTGKSTVETVYTVLHAGGKFGGGGYKVSGGLHGVGASVVNALSTWLEVKVYRDGNVYYQRYSKGGHPEGDLKVIDTCDKDRTGTTVHFLPDSSIFTETTVYEYDILKNRLKELAFLNKGLRISLYDEREADKKDSFCYEGGLVEYVQMLNKNKNTINETIVDVEGEDKDIKYNKIECILYEVNNEKEVEIDNYKYDGDSITLEDFLKNVSFHIDKYDSICKRYNKDSLYILVKANNDDKEYSKKVYLSLDDSCKK